MSKKALLRLTISGLICALLPVSQVSAGSGSPATSGEKKKCVSTGTAKATFNLKHGPTSRTSKPLVYKVSAAETVCLFYTVESVSAGGKSQTSVVLRRVETSAKVSHSGYLPEKNNAAALDLLHPGSPRYNGRTAPGSELVYSHLNPFILVYQPDKEAAPYANTPEPTYDVFQEAPYDDEDLDDYGGSFTKGAANAAWSSLLEAGFSCSKNGCRPKKGSATAKTSYTTTPGEDLFYYNLSYGRMGFRPQVGIFTRGGQDDPATPEDEEHLGQSTGIVAYWDFGPACGAEACPSGVRPQTSIKTAKLVTRSGYLDRYYADQWYHQSNTFLGLPAKHRECGGEGYPVSVHNSC